MAQSWSTPASAIWSQPGWELGGSTPQQVVRAAQLPPVEPLLEEPVPLLDEELDPVELHGVAQFASWQAEPAEPAETHAAPRLLSQAARHAVSVHAHASSQAISAAQAPQNAEACSLHFVSMQLEQAASPPVTTLTTPPLHVPLMQVTPAPPPLLQEKPREKTAGTRRMVASLTMVRSMEVPRW